MTTTIDLLPHPLPTTGPARLALFVIRRMGAHGLSDARAAHAMFTAFGQRFRRPLVLLRTLMAELASTAHGTIAIAPCCCPRMTPAEAALLSLMTRVGAKPENARFLAVDLLGARRVEHVLMAAAAVAAAFANQGRPLA